MKGVRFAAHRDVGGILDLAERYRSEGADELVFYDITASPDGRRVDRRWIERVGALLDIPFCVAGGIRSVADAEAILGAGAEKVSVNSPALENPGLVNELCRRFGSQCIVVGIDSQAEGAAGARRYSVRQYSGDATKSRTTGRATLDWLREVQDRGAGEVVLNCMASDGVRGGYDLEQLISARAACRVPLIASGGAGEVSHFRDAFEQAGIDGTLAASVFHSEAIDIAELKRYLKASGVEVRL